ncbi:MAG: homoserine O-succinyltransferase [Eubacteriales bacterium]|nr:homoserine O-succinyltransferase [Eubacteriales bacterium]
MPVKVPDSLPAVRVLTEENVFVMTEKRAASQDIRPLRIGVYNLMPTKEVTETQILRLLGNTPLQVEVVFIRPAQHVSRHTPAAHLEAFYKTFDEVRDQKFDGLIITGAPVEKLDFEEVNYWNELKELIDWADAHVYSTMYICWAAQAGLYYRHGIPKYPLPRKLSGVFSHRAEVRNYPLLRGLDDRFYAPHSRYTAVSIEDIARCDDLLLVSSGRESGVFIVAEKNGRHIYITGHVEYDADTLAREYARDLAAGRTDVDLPQHYFPDDDPSEPPMFRWRSTGTLIFANWLNYYVYQVTPYDTGLIR